MVISDLAHLTTINQENQIEGGVQLIAGSSGSIVGFANAGGRVSTGGYSLASGIQIPVISGSTVLGTTEQLTVSSNFFAFTSPV